MASAAPASRIELFEVVAAPNVPRTTPTEVATRMNPGEVVGVNIIIPDGHAGLTGIGLAVAHQVVIPRTAGAFFVGNDDEIDEPTIGYPNSGAWSAFVFNTDSLSHTFYVRYRVADFPFIEAAPPIVAPVTPLVA